MQKDHPRTKDGLFKLLRDHRMKKINDVALTQSYYFPFYGLGKITLSMICTTPLPVKILVEVIFALRPR